MQKVRLGLKIWDENYRQNIILGSVLGDLRIVYALLYKCMEFAAREN